MPDSRIYILLGLVILCSPVHGYPTGAPASTCWTRYPKHKGLGTQTKPCPFQITFSSPTYSPEEVIKVVVEDPNPNKEWFSGIQIAAFQDLGSGEEIVGEFLSFSPVNKLKTLTCFGGHKNMVTHRIRTKVQKVELTWQAPPINVGNLTFKATIVENFETFWTTVEKNLPSAGQNVSFLPKYTESIPKQMVEDVDIYSCGGVKGCFLYPRHCKDRDCLVAVTFRHRSTKDTYIFEIYSTIAENWIALGFSEDTIMGHDETISCVSNSGHMSVQHGWNPGYRNERFLTRYLSQVQVKYFDGQLQCRFELPRRTTATFIDPSSTTSNFTDIIFDRTNDLHLMVAWGKAMPASDVLAKHTDIPAVTSDKVDFKDNSIYRGSAFPVLVRVHAALMMVAWIFFGGIVTVVARHFKGFMPSQLLFGTKIWFQVHRELAIVIVVLTLIGIIAIFSHYGAEIRQFSVPHSYVGLTVVATVCAQMIAGCLRPDPNHSMRFLFNWGHRFLGQTTHILAATTMLLAFKIEYFSSDMKVFGSAVISVWIAVQLIWHITFEILSILDKRSGKWNSDSDSEIDDTINLRIILFGIYIITLCGLCTAGLLAFLLF